jgi:hypothetical protein
VNLLDTPGHADFSEDTYRGLSAVDSALIVIDSVKGVEERTRKLCEVSRMRDTPTSEHSIAAHAPALIYWADVMNMRAGDVLTLRITSPDGSVFAERTTDFDKPMALYFSFVGKKNSSSALAAGNYTAAIQLKRGAETPITRTHTLLVAP